MGVLLVIRKSLCAGLCRCPSIRALRLGEQVQKAQKALYDIASKSCSVVVETIAEDCKITGMTTRQQSRWFHFCAQPDQHGDQAQAFNVDGCERQSRTIVVQRGQVSVSTNRGISSLVGLLFPEVRPSLISRHCQEFHPSAALGALRSSIPLGSHKSRSLVSSNPAL